MGYGHKRHVHVSKVKCIVPVIVNSCIGYVFALVRLLIMTVLIKIMNGVLYDKERSVLWQ